MNQEAANHGLRIDSPPQILECQPRRFVEIIRSSLSNRGLESLAHVETIVRKLQSIIVVNELVLSRLPIRSKSSWAHADSKFTRTRARMALTVSKTCLKGTASPAFLSKMLILSSRSDT